MWNSNKLVLNTYARVDTTDAYAIIEDLSGWKKIAPTSTDGVTNVLDILNVAKANGRRVNVYIDTDEQVVATYML